MAFNAARPVPWRRIIVPFLVYAVIANIGFAIFLRDGYGVGVVLGTLVGGIAYLAITVTLVKFGWNPPRWGKGGAPPASTAATPGTARPPASAPARPGRPAPTKRTNATNPKARARR